jgi:hypothetical protein
MEAARKPSVRSAGRACARRHCALFTASSCTDIRDQLKEETKQPHVPYVFVQGKNYPSEEVMKGMKSPGAFKGTLEAAGIKVSGYFRT